MLNEVQLGFIRQPSGRFLLTNKEVKGG